MALVDQIFTLPELQEAYRKYKSYVYYNNTDVNNKIKIANFEKNIKESLNRLLNILNNNLSIEEYLTKIDYYLLPKSFKGIYENGSSNNNDYCQIISNKNICNKYNLDKYNFFIDMPIELHIISVLWILKLGYVLDEDYCEYYEKPLSCCYANRLKLDKDKKVVAGNVLFKPYVSQYNGWRDGCISKAEEMLKNKKDIIIFSLDIKGYYNSISLDFQDLKKHIKNNFKKDIKEYNFLTDYIEDIRNKYVNKIKKDFPEFIENNISFNEKLLPIGMLSSNILANWYLFNFDKNVLDKVNPIFYGRYVDDILIVIENNNTCTKRICNNNCPTEEFTTEFLLNKYLKQIFIKIAESDSEYNLANYNNLIIQSEKVKIFSFDANSSIALLTKFKDNIRKHSSEFRFLPEDDRIENDLVQEGYSIDYCDSINKLRSIEKYRLDKFKISSFLAKQLTISKYIKDKEHFTKILTELMYSFNGRLGLELYVYWYKMLIYIIVNDDINAFIDFTNVISKNIEKIQYTNKKIENILIEHLKTFFINSIKYALAYNPYFIFKKREETKDFEIKDNILNCIPEYNLIHNEINNVNSLISKIKNILDANIIKHSYCFLPMLTYFNLPKDALLNLVSSNILANSENLDADFWKNPQINENKCIYNPQNIKYSDIQLFGFYQKILTQNENYTCSTSDGVSNIKEIFMKVNNCPKYNEDIFSINNNILEIKTKENIDLSKLLIGIYNIKINENDIEKNLVNNNNISFRKFRDIMHFLNLSISNINCNLLVFPEISIPIQCIDLLQDFARRQNITIVAGLEHIIANGNVNNCIIVISPFENELYSSDNIMSIRNKKFYAPSEIGMLEEHNLNIITANRNLINPIFCWNNLYFSCFDCFELADIEFRSQSKSFVDLIIACEWNKDTNYFDKIIEASTRDLHCYVVQVNTSQFGHSKIIAPKTKDEMTLLNITGGKDNILIGEININELRAFQKLKHIPKNKYKFKPLPPNFIKNNEYPKRLK